MYCRRGLRSSTYALMTHTSSGREGEGGIKSISRGKEASAVIYLSLLCGGMQPEIHEEGTVFPVHSASEALHLGGDPVRRASRVSLYLTAGNIISPLQRISEARLIRFHPWGQTPHSGTPFNITYCSEGAPVTF